MDGILVVCGLCGLRLRARAEFAGRTMHCPKCGAAVQVPVDTEVKVDALFGQLDTVEAPAERQRIVSEIKRLETMPGKRLLQTVLCILAFPVVFAFWLLACRAVLIVTVIVMVGGYAILLPISGVYHLYRWIFRRR